MKKAFSTSLLPFALLYLGCTHEITKATPERSLSSINTPQAKCSCVGEEIPPGSQAWYFSYVLPNGNKVQDVHRQDSKANALTACSEAIRKVPACQPNTFGKDALERFKRAEKSFKPLVIDWQEQVPYEQLALRLKPPGRSIDRLDQPSKETSDFSGSGLRSQGRYVYWSQPGNNIELDSVFSRFDVTTGKGGLDGEGPWGEGKKEKFAQPIGMPIRDPKEIDMRMSPSGNFLLVDPRGNGQELWFSDARTGEIIHHIPPPSFVHWWNFHFLTDDTAVIYFGYGNYFLLVNTKGETTKIPLADALKNSLLSNCRMSHNGRKMDFHCYHLGKKLRFDFDRNGEMSSEPIAFPTYVSKVLTPDDSAALAAEKPYKEPGMSQSGLLRKDGRLTFNQYLDSRGSPDVIVSRTDLTPRFVLKKKKCYIVDPNAFPNQREVIPPGLESFCVLDIGALNFPTSLDTVVSIPSQGILLDNKLPPLDHREVFGGVSCDPPYEIERRSWVKSCTYAMGPVPQFHGNSLALNVTSRWRMNETGSPYPPDNSIEWWMYISDEIQIRYVEAPVQ